MTAFGTRRESLSGDSRRKKSAKYMDACLPDILPIIESEPVNLILVKKSLLLLFTVIKLF
jgi:hypothetical protein